MVAPEIILTIKVGVSRTTLARHRGGVIDRIRCTATPARGTGLGQWIENLVPPLSGGCPSGSVAGVLVSVLPDLSGDICRAFMDLTGCDLKIFDPAHAPFSIGYRPPEALGRDRSAAVWGALERFGEALGKSFMVADFGTHTVTTVFHEGRILGGSIAPGIVLQERGIGGERVSLDTGRGGEASVRHPLLRGEWGIGDSTADGIRTGIVLGSVGAVESLKRRAERDLGRPVSLVLTGGLACLLAPLFSCGFFLNRQLVHHGAWKFLSSL